MKFSTIILICVFVSTVSCNQASKKNSSNGKPKIEFHHTEFDFGTVKMGENLVHDFFFTNKGSGDLYIKKIDTDCGCTAAKFSKEAIKPGEQASIEVVFASEGFPGFQTKKITVFTNAKDSTVLTLAAVVDFELISN